MIQTSKTTIAGEFQEEKELQILKNTMTLQKMDQNLEVLMEKMTDFELKLNYVLLRRTKIKKKITKELQVEAKDQRSPQAYQHVLTNYSKKFRVTFIILILTCATLSVVFEIIVVDESWEEIWLIDWTIKTRKYWIAPNFGVILPWICNDFAINMSCTWYICVDLDQLRWVKVYWVLQGFLENQYKFQRIYVLKFVSYLKFWV